MKQVMTLLCCGALLALGAAAPARAAFPGVPGPIAYSKLTASETLDAGGLFVHGPRKRQGFRRLTYDLQDSLPAYSPNGRFIAFVGNREMIPLDFTTHIYLLRADGSSVIQLTSGPFRDSNPSFSPSGRRIIFDRTGLSDTTHIFIVNVDGSGLRQLTDAGGNDSDPTFTPNGRRILFVSDRDRDARSDHSDIFAMGPTGAGMRVLIDGRRRETEPDVSPNGRRIVFSSNRRRGPNIFVAKSNGRRVRQLTHSRGDCFKSICFLHPSWSPSGKHIALLGKRRYLSDLLVMRADGRNRQSFAGAGRDAEGYGSEIGAPAWGPKPR